MKRSPMARGTSQLKQKTPMKQGVGIARGTSKLRQRSKTNAKRESGGEDKLCRGQPCYLAIPGCCRNDIATVVPAHSNQLRHGKGKGIKAHDTFTVPACRDCHHELDMGMRFTKAEKFGLWDDAYARWELIRAEIINAAMKR
jgi:hypothetical protein